MVGNDIKKCSNRTTKKVNAIICNQKKHKRMMVCSSKHFTFECQNQIKRNIVMFDDTAVGEQDVSQMPTHQIRFDDGNFFFCSLIITLFSHGSQFNADQLLSIFLPFSKNPEQEEGRICIFQPTQKYTQFVLNLLKFIFAMCKRMNKLMRGTSDSTNHMDSCQGKVLFEALKTCNMHMIKGRNEIHKLLFDKKTGTVGGIYEDMKKFDQ